MENQTKINAAFIIALIATWTYVGVSGVEPTHYCESRELKAYCSSLSSTSKTCYTLLAKTGGKRCTEGWKEIPELTIEESQDYEYTASKGDWRCPPRPDKCIKVN